MGKIRPLSSDSAGRRGDNRGYTILVVVFAVFLITLGLMVAFPVWQTQIQRENEEELIFRGEQYVEAVRVFQVKNPGRFPRSFDELLEEKCIRRLYPDPMTEEGLWNVILLQQQPPGRAGRGARAPRPARKRPRQARAGQAGRLDSQAPTPQKVLIAPQGVLDAIENPQIIGVVSTDTRNSIRIYNNQTTYDKWLFFYGQDPKKLPEIVYYGQEDKNQ